MFDLGVLRYVVLPPVLVPPGRYRRPDRGARAACGVRCALGRGTATGHPLSGEERRLADAECAVAAGVSVPTAPPPNRAVPEEPKSRRDAIPTCGYDVSIELSNSRTSRRRPTSLVGAFG